MKLRCLALTGLLAACLLAGCGAPAQESPASSAAPSPTPAAGSAAVDSSVPAATAAPSPTAPPEAPDTESAAAQGESTTDEPTEPPLSEQDLQVPAPDFLPEDLQLLYRRAYKMMVVRIGTYAIDVTDYFPCDTPDTSLTYWDQLTLDGHSYAPALNHFQSWDLFYNTLDSIFTKEFLETDYLSSGETVFFRPVEGRLYYLPTERGTSAGYDQDTTKMDFVLLNESPDQIDIQVTATYAVDETGSQAFRQAWLDGLVSNTKTYTISLLHEERGWRFSQFDVPF